MATSDGFQELLQGLLKREVAAPQAIEGGSLSVAGKRGPRAGMSVQFRAVGVVVRAVVPVVCERCAGANTFAPLAGRSPGIYPVPPRGTLGLMCDRCAHVEYVRAWPIWRRLVRKALGLRL